MSAPTILDAKNRAQVRINRPGKPPVTGRVISVPTRHTDRMHSARARVQLPSGAYLTVPLQHLQTIEGEPA